MSLQSFKRKTYVYVFRNTFNGRTYVGETTMPQIRENEHRRSLERGKHNMAEIQADYDRYGNVFEFVVIEECESERAGRDAETRWMRKLFTYDERFGYNTRDWKTQSMRKAAGLSAIPSNAAGKKWNMEMHRKYYPLRKVVEANG